MSDKGFIGHVSRISPHRGDAIDGARRPKVRKRRERPLDPEPVAGTWICPACGRRTDDATDQAKHVATELYRATVLLGELQIAQDDLAEAIKDSVPEVHRITEARRSLSDEDCRRAHTAFSVLRKRRQIVPEPIRQGHNEYMRRKQAEYREKWERS